MCTAQVIFGHDVPAAVKPEEFGESTIWKRRYRRGPRARPPSLALARSPQESQQREEDILLAVARGLTNAEIGELYISLGIVKFHIASLMTKLGSRNRVELAIWAYETRRVTQTTSHRERCDPSNRAADYE
jgi:DNA-binding NarL/FixJ family response regulator